MTDQAKLTAFVPTPGDGTKERAEARVVGAKGRGRPSKYGVPTQAQIAAALDALDERTCALRAKRSFAPPSGRQLYCWRISVGYPREVAAKAACVSLRTWRNWEQGTGTMSPAQFALFAIRELGLLEH